MGNKSNPFCRIEGSLPCSRDRTAGIFSEPREFSVQGHVLCVRNMLILCMDGGIVYSERLGYLHFFEFRLAVRCYVSRKSTSFTKDSVLAIRIYVWPEKRGQLVRCNMA